MSLEQWYIIGLIASFIVAWIDHKHGIKPAPSILEFAVISILGPIMMAYAIYALTISWSYLTKEQRLKEKA